LPFEPPPFSLRTQPQRPGELAELVALELDAAEDRRIRHESARAALPVELALYIAVEAERALDDAIDALALPRAELIDFLDDAADAAAQRGVRHVLVRPLSEYAAALVRGLPNAEVDRAPLRARVPHRVAAVWAHAATAAGVPLDRWLADTVGRASINRTPWEAAAARAGRTLGEWVLLQATRCARSRSTSPQTTASA
jgi:hypothetical protein